MIVWKVLTAAQLAGLLQDGSFAGSPADHADGYVHLSTEAQLAGTLARHYPQEDGLHLAAVDARALGDGLRWEAARGGDLFPHCYAPLPLTAVVAHGPLERDRAGALHLPRAGKP